MTPFTRHPAKIVTLTRQQIESILYDMGWEPEDADVFWNYAQREFQDPGCLARERARYFAALLQDIE